MRRAPRYEDMPRERSPIDRRDIRRMRTPPPDRRRPRGPPSPVSMPSRGPPIGRDPYDDYPPPRMKPERGEPMPYKILCVSNLNQKVGDPIIRDSLMREFSRFGEVTVKVCHDSNERFAYVYFRSYECARNARHAKSRMVLFDKVLEIDPIYDRGMVPSSGSRGGRRSMTPDFGPPPRNSREPPSPHISSSRRPPPPPPPPPMRGEKPVFHPSRGPPHGDPNQRDVRNDYHLNHQNSNSNSHNTGNSGSNSQNNSNAPPKRESKKDKFPNYLHHIPPEEDDKATRTLFVGNLEVTIADADLRRIFERYGVVEDIDVKRPPPGQGNAYAFIKFLNLDMAHRAKVDMSGQYIGKFQCKIGYGKATPTTRIWVGGLGHWTSLSHLEREFDRFGAIRKIDFVKGDNHAYIQYDSIDAAQAACQEMRGFPLGGNDKKLRVDFADPGPYSFYGSPSRNSNSGSNNNSGGPGDGQFNSSGGRRSGENSGPGNEGNWSTTSSSSNKYHDRDDYGDSYNERGNSRGRDGNDRKDDNGRGDNGNSWGWWNEGANSPNGERRGGSNMRRPRTPDNDGDRKKIPRRSSMSPDGGECGSISPRRSRVSGGGIAPDSRGPGSPSGRAESDAGRGELDSVTTITELAQSCSVAWSGALMLKSSAFPAKMVHVSGNSSLIDLLTQSSESENCLLRITQRLRLDAPKLEDVTRRMSNAGQQGSCVLLTTFKSTAAPLNDATIQTRPLRNLVLYLKQKEAAGVVSLNGDVMGVLYAFPPCPFAFNLLQKVAPNLSEDNMKDDYLIIVVVKGVN